MPTRSLLLACYCLVATLATATDIATAPPKWDAQWIWQAADGPANTWMAFRKTFHIDKAPDEAVANIAVDSKYWIWINGKLARFEGGIARGPRQGATYHEPLDMAPYLKQGENTIAVLVWYWGRSRKPHQDSGRGGLVLQADLGGYVLKTDQSWKLKVHPAYDPNSGGGGNERQVPQYNIRFNANQSLGDWTDQAWYSVGYDDRSWDNAVEKGQPPAEPWGDLELNHVPPLNDRGLAYYENYPESSFPFTSTGEEYHCRLPFNRQVTPYIEVESEGGKRIFIDVDNRAVRVNAGYTTRPGRQAFESFVWVNGHYVKYRIPEGVAVHALKYRWTGVGEMRGSFECSDPDLTRLWWMARNTLYVCARDNYMDCPDRERGLWLGDVADQCGPVFYTLDRAGRELMKKAVRNTVGYSREGIIAGLVPGLFDELPNQSLQFIPQGIWRYYFNSGDRETLAYAYPAVKNYLDLWSMQENGLPAWREGRTGWADWGEGADRELIQVCWYAMALVAAKKMASELDAVGDIAEYEARLASIHENFDSVYWNGEYYTSGKFHDDRSNALAILSGLAGPERYDDLLQNVLIPVRKASPHMDWIVVEAMITVGAPDLAMRRMKERYRSQIANLEVTTLDEYLGVREGGTYNHAWNAPNFILSRYYAGIGPDSAGWSTYHVTPTMLDLTSIQHRVPSVKGDIVVEIRSNEKSFDLELVSPEGTMATVGIPKSIGRIAQVTVNGETVWENDRFPEGAHGVAGVGQDDSHLMLRIPPGNWKVSATAL